MKETSLATGQQALQYLQWYIYSISYNALNYFFIHLVNKQLGFHFHESINKIMMLLCRIMYTLHIYTVHNFFFQCTVIIAKPESYKFADYYREIQEIICCEFLIVLDATSIGNILFAALIF